jgi:hypothetical protein
MLTIANNSNILQTWVTGKGKWATKGKIQHRTELANTVSEDKVKWRSNWPWVLTLPFDMP